MTFVTNPSQQMPYENFREASQALLELLQRHIPMGLWLVVRAGTGSWTVLNRCGDGYPLVVGDTLPWNASICSQLVATVGPFVVPDLSAVPAYAETSLARRFDVQSYVGIPIAMPGGALFGCLTAMDASKKPADFVEIESCCSTVGRLLATVISLESQKQEFQRTADRLLVSYDLDPTTGLLNPAAYEHCVEFEDAYSRVFGTTVGVVVADLRPEAAYHRKAKTGLFDQALQRFGAEVQQGLRPLDLAARPQKDRVVVVLPGSDETHTRWYAQHMARLCAAHLPAARCHWTMRAGRQTIKDAIDQAVAERRAA